MNRGPLHDYLNRKLNEASARKSKAAHAAWLASQPKPEQPPVVAQPIPAVIVQPTPAGTVGSGKRKSMNGGRKGIGQLFREGLKKTVELKKLGELEQAKSVKLLQHAETPVVGSGKRRGRPKSN